MELIPVEGWANMTIKEYLNVLCNFFRYVSLVVYGYRNFSADFLDDVLSKQSIQS